MSRSISLRSGRQMPPFGLGCWQADAENGDALNAVSTALASGYRLIDTAHAYGNEEAVGQAIARAITAGQLQREELFVVTKLPFTGMHAERVERYLRESLQRLRMDYVDLFLIHTPVGCHEPAEVKPDGVTIPHEEQRRKPLPFDENGRLVIDTETNHAEIWRSMERMVELGLTRDIGLSNFSVEQIRRLMNSAQRQPAVLQVELHVHFQQKQLQEFCRQHQIVLMSYGSLGSPGRQHWVRQHCINQNQLPHESLKGNALHDQTSALERDSNEEDDGHSEGNLRGQSLSMPSPLEDPVVRLIARQHGCSAAQVLLRFLVQQRIVVIPKSVKEERIRKNAELFQFELDQLEMEALLLLDRGSEGRTFRFAEIFPGYGDHPEGVME